MINKIFIALLLAVLSTGFVWAAQPTEAAQQLVQTTSDKMLQALRQNRNELDGDSTKLYGLVDEIVLPHFDFRTMSAWVLGKYWRQATAEQRNRFTEEFRTLLVRTYASSLLDYSDENITFLPLNAPAEADDVTVRAEVRQTVGQTIPINYSMHVKNNAWKVYDVSVDGISLVTNYRSSFSDQIRKEGIDGLIQKLSARNDQEGR